MGRDLRLARHQRAIRFRVRQSNGHAVELGVIRLPELGRDQHLQHNGGQRRLDARQRNLVVRPKIGQRYDVGPVAIKAQGAGTEPGHAHDLGPRHAPSLGPKGHEAWRARARDVECAGQHRVIDDIAAVEQRPAYGSRRQAGAVELTFQHFAVAHDHQRQIQDAVPVAEADRARLVRRPGPAGRYGRGCRQQGAAVHTVSVTPNGSRRYPPPSVTSSRALPGSGSIFWRRR